MNEDAFVITATCESGHVQKLYISRELGFEYAQRFAGILDGTSEFFKISPRGNQESGIGRCGLCHAQFDAVATDPDAVEP